MTDTRWHRIDPVDLPGEDRVRSVVVDGRSVAMSRCAGRLGALENHCPHQGGPVGEGSIENGWLRCPWHGYDYDPLTGHPPEGFSDAVTAYAVDERTDGVYVELPDQPAELAALAVKHAIDGRGVAHLVLPDEVQIQPSEASSAAPAGRFGPHGLRPDTTALESALELIRAARRPVLVAGAGARGAESALTALAERLGAPVLTTFKAKGLVPDTHPLGAGVLGRSGTPVASWLMNESDLLVVVGASFSNHTGIAAYKPIVQIDDRPATIGRFHAVTAGVQGDAATVLGLLLAELGEVEADDQRPDVAARWELWRAEKYGIPVKHLLLDNHSLGKIGKEQLAAQYPVWHTSLHNPDWAEYARLCGATGIRVDRRDDLDAAMTELFDAHGPALLCVEQDPELL